MTIRERLDELGFLTRLSKEEGLIVYPPTNSLFWVGCKPFQEDLLHSDMSNLDKRIKIIAKQNDQVFLKYKSFAQSFNEKFKKVDIAEAKKLAKIRSSLLEKNNYKKCNTCKYGENTLCNGGYYETDSELCVHELMLHLPYNSGLVEGGMLNWNNKLKVIWEEAFKLFQLEFNNSLGEEIYLGAKLGKGGEGTIYELTNDSNACVKIMHNQPLNDNLINKLKAMIDFQDDQIKKIASWPLDLIFKNDKVVGLTMTKVDPSYKNLHLFLRPIDRMKYFPKCNKEMVINIIKNICDCVSIMHKNNIIIGDINESNFMISPIGDIKLIDTVSCQLTTEKEIYRCLVGKEEYTAPEYQKKNFEELIRTKDGDLFGLAIIIFQILCYGRHPFMGIHERVEEQPSIGKCIQVGDYVYNKSIRQLKNISIPKGCINPTETYSEELNRLFLKSFVWDRDDLNNVERTTPEDWMQEIKKI